MFWWQFRENNYEEISPNHAQAMKWIEALDRMTPRVTWVPQLLSSLLSLNFVHSESVTLLLLSRLNTTVALSSPRCFLGDLLALTLVLPFEHHTFNSVRIFQFTSLILFSLSSVTFAAMCANENPSPFTIPAKNPRKVDPWVFWRETLGSPRHVMAPMVSLSLFFVFLNSGRWERSRLSIASKALWYTPDIHANAAHVLQIFPLLLSLTFSRLLNRSKPYRKQSMDFDPTDKPVIVQVLSSCIFCLRCWSLAWWHRCGRFPSCSKEDHGIWHRINRFEFWMSSAMCPNGLNPIFWHHFSFVREVMDVF